MLSSSGIDFSIFVRAGYRPMSTAHHDVLAAALSEAPPRETYEIYDKCLGAFVVSRSADGAQMVAMCRERPRKGLPY